MIFLTVGTQLPFERLAKAVDGWCKDNNEVVKAQLCSSENTYNSIEIYDKLPHDKLVKLIRDAEVVIAHAGIGTIITAIENKKKLIVFPRRAKHKEHRNDHQLATAEKFANFKGVYVAWDEEQLINLLDSRHELIAPNEQLKASSELTSFLREVIK